MLTSNKTFIILLVVASFILACVAYSASQRQKITLGVTTDITATIQSAAPEGRVGPEGTNWDTDFYLTVRTADNTDDVILFTSNLVSTNNLGRYLTPLSIGSLVPDTYDVLFKGHQHLSKKLDNIYLAGGNNLLNFTQPDNSAATGTIRLLAGDISGDGTSLATLGDDVINSVDLGIMLGQLDVDDATGNNVRANLNQDIVVNSVDLSLLIKNLDLEGDN